MGWSIPWVSTARTDFNLDLGFSSNEEQTSKWVANDGAAATNRRAQRPSDGHRPRRLPDRAVRVQLVRTRRRHRLPDLLDDWSRSRVPDGLLPDPRPHAKG